MDNEYNKELEVDENGNDSSVQIVLSNSNVISFETYMMGGLSTFMYDYENFLFQGKKQSTFRYQMFDKNRNKNNMVSIRFESIVAIYCQKIV
ncbi:hypothetical protein [Acinetobacter sp. Ac_5812]|uniref:hypothetical protein n=1 Tax=Acinetobacter sp. Ac_5812 TaxID=1848937 RepID=UPI00148FC00F|nr:hypothetical protein [Acinetobacter sp. Ac_5812]NNP71251.1 hypothetical protein [Acinetobacter sp. Ac_5812]